VPELLLPGMDAIGLNAAVESDNSVVDTSGFAAIDTSRASASKKTSNQQSAAFSFSRQIVSAVLFVAALSISHVLGRYWPVFGGFFNAIADPNSPIRNHFMLHHWIAGSITGLVLCAIWIYIDYNLVKKRKRVPPKGS
jgi:hypothetical protein